jgi:hypothetical protein
MAWYSAVSARISQVCRAVQDGMQQTLEGSISTETGLHCARNPDLLPLSGSLNLLGLHGMHESHSPVQPR